MDYIKAPLALRVEVSALVSGGKLGVADGGLRPALGGLARAGAQSQSQAAESFDADYCGVLTPDWTVTGSGSGTSKKFGQEPDWANEGVQKKLEKFLDKRWQADMAVQADSKPSRRSKNNKLFGREGEESLSFDADDCEGEDDCEDDPTSVMVADLPSKNSYGISMIFYASRVRVLKHLKT